MDAYRTLCREALSGERRTNRTGHDTLSVFGASARIDLSLGFPLLTTKRVSWKNVLVENLWFLSGAEDIGLLRAHKCAFWDPWADNAGKVPSPYGHLWRHPVDQVAWAVDTLRSAPDSRRIVVTAWRPENAHTSALPPCHAQFVLSTVGGRLNLHLSQRSCDLALGCPYNWAGYAFLTHLFARFAGLEVGTLYHTITDAHVYVSHVDALEEQLARPCRLLPRLRIDPSIQTLADLEPFYALSTPTERLLDTFRIESYYPHPAVTYEVAV